MGNTGGTERPSRRRRRPADQRELTNGRLWTSQTIGVVDNGQASASATRNAVRWYEIGSLDRYASGRADRYALHRRIAGSVDTRNYFVPSIASSIRGRTIVGFTAAGTSEFANAGVAERFSTDTAGTLRTPQLVTSANTAYNPPGDPGSASRGRRWGSASATMVDGCDGTTIWTVQQFTDAVNSYGLAVARTVGPAPATPVSVTRRP